VKAINRKILICISLIILTIPAILIWYNFSWFINRSDLTATEVVAFLNEFRSNNPDHPIMQNARGWGMPASNRVEVALMDYNREQIALFRREVINSRWITFYNLRGNTNQRSEPLRTDPLLGQHISMSVTEINQEQGYVVVTIIKSAETEYTAMTGERYQVEVFRRGDWWVVPGASAFLDMAIIINLGEPEQFRKNLGWHVGSLDPGLYRIRKSVSWWLMENWVIIYNREDNYKHEIVAEFYWE